MVEFSYTAEKDGVRYNGVLDVPDRFTVYQKIREEGGKIISIASPGDGFQAKFRKWSSMISTVSPYEKVIFARTLASMLTAGLPLSRALSISERQTTNDKLKSVLSSVGEEVRKGTSFHDGLSKHPKVFSSLFISMVKAGEESGNLASALQNIAEQMDKTYKIKKQVRGALMYPSVVVVAMIGVGYLMMTQVVPNLKKTFEEVGAELPAMTRILVNISDTLVNYGIFVLLGAICFVVAFYYALHTKKGKRVSDFCSLYFPIVGQMIREMNTARAARTLASLSSAGVDIIRSLSITKEVVQNSYFQADIAKAEEAVTKGQPLSSIFTSKETIFPMLFGEMIAVGEETGSIADMLSKIASFYEDEVEQKTKNMSTVIEPLLMLFIGGGVGVFAVAIISPIYSITQNV
jgi:type IV pilus assembly protein PilC